MEIDKIIETYHSLGIEKAVNYEEFNKILITSHSTRIEGSTLTLEDSFELIQKGNTPGGQNINFSLETIDHYNALNYVLSEAEKGRKLSVEFIQSMAAMVMKNTGEILNTALGTVNARKGEFRKVGIRAGSASFMHHSKVEPALRTLVDTLNQELKRNKSIEEQLKLAFYAHYELVNIHPFLDGNGRTSRLLMNFIQKTYQLPLGFVFAEDKPEYYRALNSVKEKGTYATYYRFMFEQYKKHLLTEIKKEQSVNEEHLSQEEQEEKRSFKRKR